ncbi:MAG TPA: hypothetical protein VGF48_25895 [Thermoanaerobaculia bacterium]|jgi:hypothetical protein
MRSFCFVAVLVVMLAGCNRDRVDSANNPPSSPTTDVGTGMAPSDTSTTTRPAESVHSDTSATTTSTTTTNP